LPEKRIGNEREQAVKLNGKTVLLTGAGRGIGQATAVDLAQAGMHIIGVDLRREGLRTTAEKVAAANARFDAFACDVGDEAATRALIAEIDAKLGGFDALINNAGVAPCGPFAERDFGDWRKTVEINLLGLMALTHAALPILLKRNEGHIVNLASVSGKFGSEGLAAYAASKHGVVGFSSALRAELAGKNIGVSWICPSFVNTGMIAGITRTAWTPLVPPETVARVIRRAMETNASEVFVPKVMYLGAGIMPNLLPNAWRKMLKWTKASQGWLHANKQLEK
jgi:all-trans-retinol dehydrogenase (NAD+)